MSKKAEKILIFALSDDLEQDEKILGIGNFSNTIILKVADDMS